MGMDKEDAKWKEFVYGHLKLNNIIDGALLIANSGKILFAEGCLENIESDEVTQFIGVFSQKMEQKARGFHLHIEKGHGARGKVRFIVYHEQYHSFYATSKGNLYGLVVINLPNAILVASHSHPVTSIVAANHCEEAVQHLL